MIVTLYLKKYIPNVYVRAFVMNYRMPYISEINIFAQILNSSPNVIYFFVYEQIVVMSLV